MKILCLHGYGTSSSILKSQLDALTRRADESYDFVFFDGEVECPKAKGKLLPPSISFRFSCFFAFPIARINQHNVRFEL